MSQNLFNKTLIIGLGLIGGSFAKAIRKAQISKEIFAFDIDIESIDLAKNDGVIDGGVDELQYIEDLSSFDLIVIATPLSAYEEIFDEIANRVFPKTIVIDLGSLKSFINKILPKNLENNFIGCHPIAGSEKINFENSEVDLFLGKKFVICKNPENSNEIIKKVENLAKSIGCDVDFIDADKHDEIYALVSHLPQFLSFLTKEFSPKNIEGDFLNKAFRLDNSDPDIWADIFELNEENLEEFYLEFFDNLEEEISIVKHSQFALPNQASQSFTDYEIQYFEENFAPIFFRALIVLSYLKIPAIKNFKIHAGSGFKDFTSIIEILNFAPEKLQNLISKNQKKILNLFSSIS